ncbi:MAG: hypothetical protein LBJ59_00825, partial [Zoogloeaceae bacterium]|nr:hypothetical protein [Zoogloeaceae bacterium]
MAGELFGDSASLADGKNAANGFLVLADFDTNADGVIDAQDEVFAQLRVWQDKNSDGVTDAGELFTLEEA